MPRDATDTRERLIRSAERLFARHGTWQVSVREITHAAGQRNASVIHYHFGSIDGLREVILGRHGEPLDAARAVYLGALGHDPSTAELVDALVVPYSGALATPHGRDYLRIVAQYTGFFSNWESMAGGHSRHVVEILRALRDRQVHLSPEIREQRIVGVVILISGAMGERAKAIEHGRDAALDDDRFRASLASMIVAALEAP